MGALFAAKKIMKSGGPAGAVIGKAFKEKASDRVGQAKKARNELAGSAADRGGSLIR